MVDIKRTFGALLVGGIIAAVFCGVTQVQVFAYFKYYPNDQRFIKMLVLFVWILDSFHTVFVTMSLWDHLISHFGEASRIDFIPWSLALTIAVTAVLTFLVHLFFVYRIFKLSNRNFFIAVPLALMACARLCFACLTTAKLIQLRSLAVFVRLYRFSFTSGLALSSSLDIIITACMCFLLRRSHKKDSSMNRVLDALMLYTFENGSLTCAATCMSLITWITMPTNLIFMGLHFVISKFYANSLLATLNTRKELKPGHHRSQGSGGGSADRMVPIMFPDSLRGHRKQYSVDEEADLKQSPPLEIKVNQTTMSVTDGDSPTGMTASDPRV